MFETLEARLLMSADVAPVAVLAPDAFPPLAAEHRLLDALVPPPSIDFAAQASRPRELVLIDASLPDRERLLADVIAATGGAREVEVVLLDPAGDGFAQVGAALAARSDLAAVHIVTHGSEGRLRLGATTLDAAALEANADAVAGWGRAFAGDGDLLLYGCDVAARDAAWPSSPSGRFHQQPAHRRAARGGRAIANVHWLCASRASSCTRKRGTTSASSRHTVSSIYVMKKRGAPRPCLAR